MLEDNYRHKGLRKQLADSIAQRAEFDQTVINAISEIPRHLFMDQAFLNFAYEDKAFPIGEDQTISQPYTVAVQTHLLGVTKGQKVLEIGTGSGYQTAVLCHLGARVFSIERQKKLFDKTKVLLSKLGYSTAKLFFGDGYKGLPTFAPFDRIIVTAGAPEIPKELLGQLKVGGRMVIPVNEGDYQVMKTIDKVSETAFEENLHGEFRFVPMLGNKNW